MEFQIDQLKIQSWKNTRTYNQMFNSYLEEKKGNLQQPEWVC